MPPHAARLAIERGLKLPDGGFAGLPQRAQGHKRDAIAFVALGLEEVIPAIDRLADHRLGVRIAGCRPAGPPAHMIAFQASHSSRSASRSFSSAALRMSADLSK